jgi:alpha-ketoglutarate-dependent taurine dioxygenase
MFLWAANIGPMTMSTVNLDVRPLSPTIGAEILGINCSADLADDVIAAIRQIWLERLVVFFPDQELDDGTRSPSLDVSAS